jgi:hypothetical protein
MSVVFIAKTTWITETVKKNQNCWNCDHFQRFDDNEPWGECRKEPLKKPVVGGITYLELLVPFIVESHVYWCSGWQASTVEVPPLPTFPPSIPYYPTIVEDWIPWNKKIGQNISCWNCNHYQPEDPEKTEDGECRKYPVLPHFWGDIVGYDEDAGLGVEMLYPGIYFWCGCWEKCEDDRPDPPIGPKPPPRTMKQIFLRGEKTRKALIAKLRKPPT